MKMRYLLFGLTFSTVLGLQTVTFARPNRNSKPDSISVKLDAVRAHLRVIEDSILSFRIPPEQPAPVPKPNWAQEWSAYAAIGSASATLLLTMLLFRLKKQQDIQSNQIQSYIKILDRMELIRPDRYLIRKFIEEFTGNKTGPFTRDWWSTQPLLDDKTVVEEVDEKGNKTTEPIKDVLNRVTREFDILGFMDRRTLVDRRLVDEFYAPPLIEFTPIFCAYIQLLLKSNKRDASYLWELRQFMERVPYVKHNHPGIRGHGEKKWMRNPRRDKTASVFSKRYWIGP